MPLALWGFWRAASVSPREKGVNASPPIDLAIVPKETMAAGMMKTGGVTMTKVMMFTTTTGACREGGGGG